jgi:PmbA protein
VKVSSAEIFLDFKEEEIFNSNGLEVGREESEALIEGVLLAEQDGGFGGESGCWKQGRFYADLNLHEAFEKYARYAREAQEASLPASGIFPVVFSEEALDTLFNYFVMQSSGGARFQGWSRMETGGPVILNLRGEALTLTSNPALPGLLKTRAFDTQGLPVQKVAVIQENVFRQRTNNKRYADYLGEPATGDFANVEVAPGLQSTADLLGGGPCFHLLRFSTFEPNPITGAFSGEIRTGYLLKDGQVLPVKGGSVSGVIAEAFRQAYFSREVTQRAAYSGPEAVRLEGLEIAGE